MSFQNSTPQTPKNQAPTQKQQKTIDSLAGSMESAPARSSAATPGETATSQPANLGVFTESLSAPPEIAESVVDLGYGKRTNQVQNKQDLLHAAKELLPKEKRLQACLALRVDADQPVGLEYSENADRARVTNVCQCGNPFLCPNCGPIAAEKKAALLRGDLTVWDLAENVACFGVFTMQHFGFEFLNEVDTRIDTALGKLFNNRPGKRFWEKWGLAGRQRGPDVTFGKNGWHSHRNLIIYFGRRRLSLAESKEFKSELVELWQECCKSVGGYADKEHGVKVRWENLFNCADYIASKAAGVDYEPGLVDREGWGVAEELSKNHLKDGHSIGLTPTGLLAAYLSEDHSLVDAEEAGRLWQEYADVFKGKRFVWTSQGFRAVLNDLKEKFKDEIQALALESDDEIPEWNQVAFLGPEAWAQIVKFEILLWLLDEVKEAKGDPVKIRDFLLDFEIDQVYYPALDENLPDWWPSETQKLAESVQAQELDVDQIKAIQAFNEFIKKWNNWEI